VSSQRGKQSSVNASAAQWASGLGQIFSHVALFDLSATVATVASVHGLSRSVVGKSLSLTAQTPLRWAVDAASALVGSGHSPGGMVIARGLGLDRPRAYAVLPLVVEGKLVALAYVDNGRSPLSMSAVSQVFDIVDATLRNDIPYTRKTESSRELADTGRRGSEHLIDHQFDSLAPVDASQGDSFIESARLRYEPEPDDLAEIEAMIDEALANNPLMEQPSDESHEESSTVVFSLQEHIRKRDDAVEKGREEKESSISQAPTESVVTTTIECTEVVDSQNDNIEDSSHAEVSTSRVPLPRFRERRIARSYPRKTPEQKRSERKEQLRKVLDDSEPLSIDKEIMELVPDRLPLCGAVSANTASDEAPPAPAPAPALDPKTVSDPTFSELPRTESRAEGSPEKLLSNSLLQTTKKILVAASIVAIVVGSSLSMNAPTSNGPPAGFTFRVHSNSSLNQIAEHLEIQGVIRSSFAFKLLARLQGVDRKLKAGRYSIPPGAWSWDVLRELRNGQVRSRTITIPEGLTLQETAEMVEASGLVTTDAFILAAKDSELLQAYGIKALNAEGFLFPETYKFSEDISAKNIVKSMLDLFFAKFGQMAGAAKLEIGPKELLDYVTLASIIEREAKSPNEMFTIAGVFTNRLAKNMRLESCATIQYILGKPKQRLLLSDLRKESPYNTYLRPGLPPGPISNPSSKALQAALTPQKHNYLFFLAKIDGSNEHIFTQTYSQHQKARLLQKQMGAPNKESLRSY